MAKLVAVIAALASLVLVSAWIARGGRVVGVETVLGSSKVGARSRAAEPRALDPVASEGAQLPPPASASDERKQIDLPGECRVAGFVVDDLDRPIARVHVLARTIDDTRETTTDAVGAFELALPPGATDRCSIHFDAGSEHVEGLRRFGSIRLAQSAPLAPGNNALGRIVLACVRTVTGRVALSDGRAVSGVVVRSNQGRSEATTDVDGTFHMEGVVGSDLAVDEQRVLRIDVSDDGGSALGAARVEVVIAGCALIGGVVLDSDGEPLADAKVRGYALDGDYVLTPSAICDEDGRFCLVLSRALPYALGACRSNEAWPGTALGGARVAPDEMSARITVAERRHGARAADEQR